jgi:pSer/pThr/pTyr-binding forkhead associated (FHA) protein
VGTAVVLVVVKGQDAGVRVVVRPGHCAMVGRSPLTGRGTGMLTEHSLQRLVIEDHAVVERHLQARPAEAGGRALFDSFARDVDVQLNDDAVSAVHAMLFCDDAGASLLDMGSTNGTFVNGARAGSVGLVPGDLVRVGETRFCVEAASADDTRSR